MDNHGRAVISGRVIDPGLDVTVILLGRPACFVERVGDAIWPDDAIGRAGERVGFLGPARSIDADKAEAFGVIAWIGVMDVEIDEYTLGVCSYASYFWYRRGRRRRS
jgi:hypothetical protein